jgi:hypothetical protein
MKTRNTLNEPLYKTADGSIVRKGTGKAVELFKPAGAKISDEELTALGLDESILAPVRTITEVDVPIGVIPGETPGWPVDPITGDTLDLSDEERIELVKNVQAAAIDPGRRVNASGTEVTGVDGGPPGHRVAFGAGVDEASPVGGTRSPEGAMAGEDGRANGHGHLTDDERRSVDGAAAGTAGDPDDREDDEDLSKLKRTELDERALALGVEEPDKLGNKDKVITAIEAAEQALAAAGEGNAA